MQIKENTTPPLVIGIAGGHAPVTVPFPCFTVSHDKEIKLESERNIYLSWILASAKSSAILEVFTEQNDYCWMHNFSKNLWLPFPMPILYTSTVWLRLRHAQDTILTVGWFEG